VRTHSPFCGRCPVSKLSNSDMSLSGCMPAYNHTRNRQSSPVTQSWTYSLPLTDLDYCSMVWTCSAVPLSTS
jgi:hypothetical protein